MIQLKNISVRKKERKSSLLSLLIDLFAKRLICFCLRARYDCVHVPVRFGLYIKEKNVCIKIL